MLIRERVEAFEKENLSPYAKCAADSIGRNAPEPECDIRTCFRRDNDRILHSKAFRRLKHKTQVFISPEGDHYRTRLTHTLEVTQIARTIARALRLNEDLTEAIAMGHDLGHTPFGHSGERVLSKLTDGGFTHNRQSVRVVEFIENKGRGLNLTYEVTDGILRHSGDIPSKTLEGRIVHLADRIAYINHDIDDAHRAGVLNPGDIPENLLGVLGETHRERINTLISDVISESSEKDEIRMSKRIEDAMLSLRDFMFERVYRTPAALAEEEKVCELIEKLYYYYMKNKDKLPREFLESSDAFGLSTAVCDYIAGMTDRYAVAVFTDIFIPSFWKGV